MQFAQYVFNPWKSGLLF